MGRRPNNLHLLERWVEALEANQYAPATIDSYRRAARYWLVVLEGKHVLDATRQDAVRFMQWGRKQGWAAATVRDVIVGIRQWYAFLAGERLGPVADPFLGLRLPQVRRVVRPHLTQEQVIRLLAIDPADLRGIRDAAIFAVLYATGCRSISLRRLDVDDVNLEAGTIVITNKGGNQRLHALWPPAVEAVAKYLRWTRPVWAKPGEKALFVGRHGHRISHTGVGDALDRMAARARVPKFSPHWVRRTVANHLRDAGAPAEVAQQMLDHADLRTTQDHYLAPNDPLRLREEAMYHPMANPQFMEAVNRYRTYYGRYPVLNGHR